MKKVDFFIVGAPKCGTTSMAMYLNQHPKVIFSKNKEPYFFCDDFSSWKFDKSIEDYHSYNFNDFKDDGCIYGEASTWYLYSKKAIRNIFEYNENARIILMLRNPPEMLHSLYEFRNYGGTEYDLPFSEIWKYNCSRKSGKKIPYQWHHEKELLFYDEIAMFGSQLENLYKYFDPQQVKVILFDDFINSTSDVYQDTLKFLNLDEFNDLDFFVHNAGRKNIKFRFLRVLFKSIFRYVPYVAFERFRYLVGSPSFESLLLKAGLIGEGKSSQLDASLKKEILRHYIDDIKKLEKLTTRNLAHWYRL